MKYLILIYGNPTTLDYFVGLSEEERRAAVRGKRVLVRDGATIVTDGPFAEVKEHLAGFYLVDCESAERALELAAQVPDAQWGMVELRPVLDLDSV